MCVWLCVYAYMFPFLTKSKRTVDTCSLQATHMFTCGPAAFSIGCTLLESPPPPVHVMVQPPWAQQKFNMVHKIVDNKKNNKSSRTSTHLPITSREKGCKKMNNLENQSMIWATLLNVPKSSIFSLEVWTLSTHWLSSPGTPKFKCLSKFQHKITMLCIFMLCAPSSILYFPMISHITSHFLTLLLVKCQCFHHFTSIFRKIHNISTISPCFPAIAMQLVDSPHAMAVPSSKTAPNSDQLPPGARSPFLAKTPITMWSP